jgi:hypothetical protein
LKKLFAPNLYVALLHYPVINKNGDTIASAVTNLDLHDISRVAKTYGVKAFYVVTPLTDQQALVKRIVSHWVSGVGSRYNPKRRAALELIRIKTALDDVIDHIKAKEKATPVTVVTGADQRLMNGRRKIGFYQFREMLKKESVYLLIFGTGWGLSRRILARADYLLEPVTGCTGYNHLSVRSAASIILDRLLGR